MPAEFPENGESSGSGGAFAVWAPVAITVELVLADATIAMNRDDDGWWRAPRPETAGPLDAPIDYGFLVDGEGPFPDPRSRHQPNGVHGLSRTVPPRSPRTDHARTDHARTVHTWTGHARTDHARTDHARTDHARTDHARTVHAWTVHTWTGRQLAGSTIYELHLGTFTPEGTLDAAAGKLAHLASIGVDFVELLPVNAFNGTHNWGYDGVLWYAVHEGYGGPAAYRRFVDACHQAGIGVIQDVVYNHLGPSGNYLGKFGPYLSDAAGNSWGSSLNLDGPDSNEVRRYIIDNALMWLGDYHVDGLRLDAVHALHDDRATHLLEELAIEVDALSAHVGRPLSLIAESDLNDPRLITTRDAGGYGLTGAWSDDFHHAVHVALTGETTGYYADFAPLGALAKVLTRGFFHDGTFSSFRARTHGRPIDTERMPAWRLVVANQNHDQIGNRATGDRLSAQLDLGQLAIAATLTLLGPFTPMLFMGEEWGAGTPWQFFTSHPEPELGEATAKGRISEFARMGWDPALVPDPQDPATFTRSRLDWTEPDEPEHARLLAFYRDLAALRRGIPAFTDPRFDRIQVDFDDRERWLRLRRGDTEIVLNLGEEPCRVATTAGRPAVSFATEGAAILGRDPHGLTLARHAVAVFCDQPGSALPRRQRDQLSR